jgi:hypothetical protein
VGNNLKDWIREASGLPGLADDAILIQKTLSGGTRISLIHSGCCHPTLEIPMTPAEISRDKIFENRQLLIHHH